MELDQKNSEVAAAAVAEEDPALLDGIDPCFHDVVRRYGRPLWSVVMNAGMIREALGRMAALAQKHHSRDGLHAVEVLGQAAGQLATDYAHSQGWTQGDLAQCDRDVQLAFASKVATPGSSIILPH